MRTESDLQQASPPIEIVDSVGAGDASIGGLLYSLMNHPDAGWPAHLRRAVAAGDSRLPASRRHASDAGLGRKGAREWN